MSTPEIAVDQRVVRLGDDREAVVADAVDEPQLPQRLGAVQALGEDAAGQPAQLVLAGGRGQRGVAHVVAGVEVRVVDPHRPALHERRERRASGGSGGRARAAARSGRRSPRTAGASPSNSRTEPDVHVRAALLEREERRVEAGQAVGVAHRRIVAHHVKHYTECLKTFNSVYSSMLMASTRCRRSVIRRRSTASTTSTRRGVYAAALRILGDHAQAQDVTQDVFLRLWRRPGAFDAGRGELGAYLRLMARSRALDLWREGQAARARCRPAQGRRRGGRGARRGRARARAPSATRRARRCAARCASCRSAQREALVLAYWGGMTADEIARRASVPLGTAKSRIRLGLARLREEYGAARLAERRAPPERDCAERHSPRRTRRYPRTLVRPPSRGTRRAAGGGPIARPGRRPGPGRIRGCCRGSARTAGSDLPAFREPVS